MASGTTGDGRNQGHPEIRKTSEEEEPPIRPSAFGDPPKQTSAERPSKAKAKSAPSTRIPSLETIQSRPRPSREEIPVLEPLPTRDNEETFRDSYTTTSGAGGPIVLHETITIHRTRVIDPGNAGQGQAAVPPIPTQPTTSTSNHNLRSQTAPSFSESHRGYHGLEYGHHQHHQGTSTSYSPYYYDHHTHTANDMPQNLVGHGAYCYSYYPYSNSYNYQQQYPACPSFPQGSYYPPSSSNARTSTNHTHTPTSRQPMYHGYYSCEPGGHSSSANYGYQHQEGNNNHHIHGGHGHGHNHNNPILSHSFPEDHTASPSFQEYYRESNYEESDDDEEEEDYHNPLNLFQPEPHQCREREREADHDHAHTCPCCNRNYESITSSSSESGGEHGEEFELEYECNSPQGQPTSLHINFNFNMDQNLDASSSEEEEEVDENQNYYHLQNLQHHHHDESYQSSPTTITAPLVGTSVGVGVGSYNYNQYDQDQTYSTLFSQQVGRTSSTETVGSFAGSDHDPASLVNGDFEEFLQTFNRMGLVNPMDAQAPEQN